MTFFVYVLISETTGRRYVGHTENLQRRLAEHNDSQHNPAKYTTKHPGPWRLIYQEAHNSRAEAMARERWLKSGVGRQWLNRSIG
ncbi:MAG: GIY-YIG nuclease family protein [Planctomycetes bacterium]|nr:GIY-YIG nuclease family protein [Planctomycetota bacterium]